MFRFHADRSKEVDQFGDIVSTIVRWTESREEFRSEVGQIIPIMAAAVLGALFLASVQPDEAFTLRCAAGGLFLLGVGLAFRSLCVDEYEMTFRSDGTMTMPRRLLVNWLLGPRVIGDHRCVASIQMQESEPETPMTAKEQAQKPRRYEVWMYFDDGWSFAIAETLTKRQAHNVCVLMEQALAEIRKVAPTVAVSGELAWADVAID